MPPTLARPRPLYNRDLIMLINVNTKEEDPHMPPTPARPMPKYIRALIILILKRRTSPCRRPRPGLGQNTIEI